MRLTPEQAQTIRQRTQRCMVERSRMWLFGSRADEARRGGDVDLYVEPDAPPSLPQRLLCRSALADALDLRVDLVVKEPRPADLPHRQAQRSAVVTDQLAMRAVSIDEQDANRFGSVLAFMARLQVLDDTEHWKPIRELRNAVNHEYDEDTGHLADIFASPVNETEALVDYHLRLQALCTVAYGLSHES